VSYSWAGVACISLRAPVAALARVCTPPLRVARPSTALAHSELSGPEACRSGRCAADVAAAGGGPAVSARAQQGLQAADWQVWKQELLQGQGGQVDRAPHKAGCVRGDWPSSPPCLPLSCLCPCLPLSVKRPLTSRRGTRRQVPGDGGEAAAVSCPGPDWLHGTHVPVRPLVVLSGYTHEY